MLHPRTKTNNNQQNINPKDCPAPAQNLQIHRTQAIGVSYGKPDPFKTLTNENAPHISHFFHLNSVDLLKRPGQKSKIIPERPFSKAKNKSSPEAKKNLYNMFLRVQQTKKNKQTNHPTRHLLLKKKKTKKTKNQITPSPLKKEKKTNKLPNEKNSLNFLVLVIFSGKKKQKKQIKFNH